MQGQTKERWMQLAATEQDPVKLLRLIREINELLAQKQERLIKASIREIPQS
jgi:hypothetical protein